MAKRMMMTMRMAMTLKLALFYCDDISTGSSSGQIVKTKTRLCLQLEADRWTGGQADGRTDRWADRQTNSWKLRHIVNGRAR